MAVVVLSFVIGLAALPALPTEVAIHWGTDGSPNTVIPALPGVLLIPSIALLTFAFLRGGALLSGRSAELGPWTGLGVIAGVAYLQAALVALNLGVAVTPLVAVLPGILVIVVATYAERTGVTGGV